METGEQEDPGLGAKLARLANPASLSYCCCSGFLQPRNKVLPQGQEHPDPRETGVQYVEASPGRRLRVVVVQAGHPPSPSSLPSPKEEEGELSEEEYWFESAAPNRLPVIQPLPPPPHSRIINKFEPQEPSCSQVGSPRTRTSPGDCISPGRLPRKKLGSRVAVEDEADDYEDDQMESHTGGDGASSPPTGLLGQMSDMLPDPASPRDSSSPISPSLDTKTSVSDLGRTVSRTSLDQGKLVSLGNTDYHDLSPTQDCLPRIEVSPPRSPDPLADDSCHPSPELPHRTVCVAPDPDISDTEDIIPTNSLKVMGGNLGGMANQAFNPDDYRDEEGSDTATLSADDVQELDGAYGRNRNLQEVLDTVIPLSPVLDNTDTIPGTATVSSVLQTSVTLPLMLFLHGVGGSADIWRAQLSHFSLLGYTCLAPDMLGHGFSACPDSAKAYTFSRLFKDVLAIFDAFVSEDKRAVVFGHSYGCSFSVALARARPERVCTLVLVAGGGPTPLAPPPDKAPRPVMHCLLTLLRRVLECKPGSSQQKYNPRGKTLKFKPAYDVPSYVLNHMMAGQVWSEGDAGFHRRVTVPSLLVYGMRDCLVSLVEECEMERTLPKAFLELVPGAGHAVMLDTPAQFNTMTERFVKKWTGGMH